MKLDFISDMKSHMSTRGRKEMNQLFSFAILLSALVLIMPIPEVFKLNIFGILFLIAPCLLFVLDIAEQKHPALQPYFNPFDRFRKDVKVFKTDSSGQLSIMGLLAGFLMIVTFAALLPALRETLDAASPNLTAMEQTLVDIIPLAFIIAILGGIFYYSRTD